MRGVERVSRRETQPIRARHIVCGVACAPTTSRAHKIACLAHGVLCSMPCGLPVWLA